MELGMSEPHRRVFLHRPRFVYLGSRRDNAARGRGRPAEIPAALNRLTRHLGAGLKSKFELLM